MENPGSTIRSEGVTRRFEGTGLVVDHLSLSIASGEFVALLGPSGCGKSTFLRLLAGLDYPDSGRLLVGSARASRFRGFVFQESHLVPWRTVERNVSLPLELIGLSRAECERRAREQLKRVGLIEAIDRYPAQLSGGMKMRASVARALVTEPTLLLLDEPFSALDEKARHELQDELRGIWRSSRITVVFVTHSVSEAAYLSSRLIVLSKRPARVILDRESELAFDRGPAMRTSPEFARELKAIYDSVPREKAEL